VPRPLSSATITLNNVSHTYAADLDILLVGPAGQAIMLMSDAGSYHPIDQATLGFSDGALNALPQNSTILSGVYRPTDYPPSDNMPEPAPLGPYQINLSALNGTDANGTWSLYVVDDALTDTGSIAGWSLTLAWDAASPPVRPQLSAPVCRSDGCRQTTLSGQLGKTYVIQTSTDLLTWKPMATNTLQGVTWDFVDATSTNCNQKFYRAICLP
jgi:subtilisin-like proprotein convertase family protein